MLYRVQFKCSCKAKLNYNTDIDPKKIVLPVCEKCNKPMKRQKPKDGQTELPVSV